MTEVTKARRARRMKPIGVVITVVLLLFIAATSYFLLWRAMSGEWLLVAGAIAISVFLFARMGRRPD